MRKEYKVYLHIADYKLNDCYEVTIDESDRYDRENGFQKAENDTQLAIEKAIQRVACEMGCNIRYDDVSAVAELINDRWIEVYPEENKL